MSAGMFGGKSGTLIAAFVSFPGSSRWPDRRSNSAMFARAAETCAQFSPKVVLSST